MKRITEFLKTEWLGTRHHEPYQYREKRVLDLTILLCVAIPLLPIVLIVAVLVRLKLGTPILFRQQRPGQYGKPFTILKFRTMTDERDQNGDLLPDSVRLTRFGRFLRSTSLDELPELINVFKGEMSLVGPRPLLMHYLKHYTPEQMRRHYAKPGITGWAQVNGRNELTWEEKFALDLWYLEHQSLWLDLKIIVLTVWQVISRQGINQQGHATVQEFSNTQRI
jgi:sugar transferase EpsL